jgi:phosphatidate cytidylyltransferase
MLIRTLSALIIVPVLLGLTWLGGLYTAFLVAVISILALRECLAIGQKMGLAMWSFSTGLFSLTWLLLVFRGATEWMLPLLIIWLLFSLGKMALRYPTVQFSELGYNFFAPIYTVVLFSQLFLIRGMENGIAWSFLTFILVWMTDTFAYLIGRALGRRLLAPQVSPKKTVEGSIGGLLFCILSGFIAWKVIGGPQWTAFLGLSLLVGISAQIGDLFESALKRSVNIKDSGNLIPGHGGILDRFDSLLFVIPLMYFWLFLNGMAG